MPKCVSAKVRVIFLVARINLLHNLLQYGTLVSGN